MGLLSKSILNAQTHDTDLVEISYVSACCPVCGKYRGRIFSISGKDKRFPKLPDDFHEDCGLIAFPFIYGVNETQYCKSKDIIGYNNCPFRDTRTAEEKENYELELQAQKNERQKERDKIDYDWLLAQLPENCPKSFSAYRRIKNSNSPSYQKLIAEAQSKGFHINNKGNKFMYCPNCGQQNPENVQFCPNCGISQQNPHQQHTEHPQSFANHTPPSQQKNKWYQKTSAIILLLIVFFPVGLFLMWKHSNWSKVVKIIITVIIIILALFSLLGEDKTDSNNDTTTSTSASATIATEQTTEAPATIAENKNIAALTDISTLTAEEAKEIFDDLKAAGIDNIDSISIVGSQSDVDSGASFNVSYNGYSVNLIVINRKTDYISSGDIVLFENGKVIDNINNYTISTSEKGSFIYNAKEYVLQGLKSPSTAEFPGTLLEIGEWSVTRNKDVVTVKSYVDSQNGFGAMIRSNFAVQMSYDSKTLLYMEIGDTVVYGNPQ